MGFVRFSDVGEIEVCVVGEKFVPIPSDDRLFLETLPVPVQVRAFATQVVVTMRIDTVTLHAAVRIDRRSHRVLESSVCLPLSLTEWSIQFRDFLG